MDRSSYRSGAIFQRGDIWYVSFWVGRTASRSKNLRARENARTPCGLRDQLLGRKVRGEFGDAAADKVTCGEVLDDLLEHAKTNFKPSTEKITRLVIEASIRPFFGHRKATNLTTALLKEYRRKRASEGRTESTCNRERSILRMALNLGRKCTPPKVTQMSYFRS